MFKDKGGMKRQAHHRKSRAGASPQDARGRAGILHVQQAFKTASLHHVHSIAMKQSHRDLHQLFRRKRIRLLPASIRKRQRAPTIM